MFIVFAADRIQPDPRTLDLTPEEEEDAKWPDAVGPFAAREAAEKVAEDLRLAGLNAYVRWLVDPSTYRADLLL
jgi:cell division septation protein DedD